MNEIKQSSIYLRVLWLNDNENLRPNNLYVHVEGDIVEETTFTITSTNNNVGNNSPWENVTEWANGITYNYQKELQETSETDIEEDQIISNIPYVIPSVTNIPTNYRCNILKNVETEEYSYYTIKMTYVPPKRKLMARSVSPTLNFNGTQIENVSFNGTQIDKVVYNGVTVFEKSATPLFKDIILANSTLNEGTPNFSLTATTDEGMFETDDPMYGVGAKSQYFRGAVTNNYVKFANFWWRIIRINGDGSIRLIYDGTSAHANGTNTADSIAVTSQIFNLQSNNKAYLGWTYILDKPRPESGDVETNSNAKEQMENWYSTNLASYNNKIVDGKFCNDRTEAPGYSWTNSGTIYCAPYYRMNKTQPSLEITSPEDVYFVKIGLLTSDETIMAGARYSKNISYYLYNGQKYWTMSPYWWSGYFSNIYYININGYCTNDSTKELYGLRPVINLASDVQVTGTGTIDDPYVVA